MGPLTINMTQFHQFTTFTIWRRDTVFNSQLIRWKVFKLAYNQLCGIQNNRHPNREFLGWLRTTYYRECNKRVAKRLWVYSMSRPKDSTSSTCYNFWYRALFRYKHCLFKRFNFYVHKAASTVEWRVLEDCYDNRFSCMVDCCKNNCLKIMRFN